MAIQRVTVFGGSGFLGRRVVARLSADGFEVRVAVRHPERAAAVPGLGRAELVRANVSEDDAVARAVAEADAVINCVGHYVETAEASFDAIHALGASRVARRAQAAGVDRLILISSLGADPDSGSRYVRARGRGEILVREAFEAATVLRPGVIFGPEDAFFGRLAELARRSPVLPLFGRGATRLQPVFVDDVAQACVRALTDGKAAGGLYELGGPRVYCYRDLVELVLKRLGRRSALLPVPFFLWDLLAFLMAPLANPPLTRDQVTLMRRDNVASGDRPGLEELGITPTSVEEILPRCLGR